MNHLEVNLRRYVMDVTGNARRDFRGKCRSVTHLVPLSERDGHIGFIANQNNTRTSVLSAWRMKSVSRKTNKKVIKGSSMYAQTRQLKCEGCGKSFVILKTMSVNGKMAMFCSTCIAKESAKTLRPSALRQ